MSLSTLESLPLDLDRFADRYRPLFGRPENYPSARSYLRGILGRADRKSVEPLALDQGVPVRTLQHFAAQARWRDELVLQEHHRHVSQTLGRPDGVLILDSTSFPKKGAHSVGVHRQWCGQLGKLENCQVGIFLSYAGGRGHTLLDRRLYLPESWASDPARRLECHVPDWVSFKTAGELAWEMIQDARRHGVPHRWVTGDEDFGKMTPLADHLHAEGFCYVFEVGPGTSVWAEPPHLGLPHHQGPGRLAHRPVPVGREKRSKTVSELRKAADPEAFVVVRVRPAEKGPLQVRAAMRRVWLSRDGMPQRPAWLLITETLDAEQRVKYFLAELPRRAPVAEILRAAYSRWSIEQCFEQGKQELGMGQYELRSWGGWHHHMTMVLLAHHFLVLTRLKQGEKRRALDRGGSSPHPPDAAGASGQAP